MNIMYKYITRLMAVAVMLSSCISQTSDEYTITKDRLKDKIKGGWAGQTIGCTYGGPTEFRYNGTMINDNIPIEWPDGYIKYYYDSFPGLYDDVYMDLTFVEVFDREGLDAPVSSFEKAFSTAGYMLWHANQQARYNILNGMSSPASGYWENNPHADDIDFQIEADYAGLMSPGMVNAASHFCDGIGHMMNYGDGWYGGVYVAAMYALAFVSDNIYYIVNEALKVIPEQSKYYKCMSDVIKWHKMYPDNWELTWAQCQKEWSFDIGCPDGVYSDFNIDATINSAYILIGLLYGNGDFEKTMEIATRCGQDSDCNPASAAGILGTMIGYSNIPDKWINNLHEVENINFAHTDISLNKVYAMSFNHAIQVIKANGGTVEKDDVTIKIQTPEAVRLEQSFEGHWPIGVIKMNKEIREVENIKFNGKGIVVKYTFMEERNHETFSEDDYVAEIRIVLDGEAVETVTLPAKMNSRKQELFYKYKLEEKEHELSFQWLNPENGRNIYITSYIPYTSEPLKK